MIRVLHLIESEADFEAQRGAETLARQVGENFVIDTRIIGRGAPYRDAIHAAASLRRGSDEFDLVHAWGRRALTAAALGTRWPIVFSAPAAIDRRLVGWLRAVMQYRRVESIC